MKTTKNYSEYDKKAFDFLNKIGVKMTSNFVGYKLHFQNDKECRDVFNIVFKRIDWNIHHTKTNRFSLKFGQSINKSTGNGDNKPTAYDVLACIQKYEIGSFNDFCKEFGYSEDSISANKLYKLICKEYKKVNNFFSENELNDLQEIR